MFVPDHSSAFAPDARQSTVPATMPAKVETARNPVFRAGKRIAVWYTAWKHRRAVSGLLFLDDHLLRDIGLSRSDISSALSLPRSTDPSVRLRQSAEARRGRRGGFASPAELDHPAPRQVVTLSGELF